MDIIIKGQVYLLLLLYFLIVVWLESSKVFSRYKYFFLFVSSFLLCILIGCRWETGTDWLPYKNLFETLQLDWTFLINVYHFELGYVLFNAIIKLFTSDYSIFLLINAAVTIGLLAILLKKITFYPNISLLLFYSNFCIIQFMGSNRRMMAMVLVLWVFYYYVKTQYKKGYVSLGFAFLLHKTSIIAFFAKYIKKEVWPAKRTLKILLICLVIGVLGIPQLLLDQFMGLISYLPGMDVIDQLKLYSENEEEHIQTGTGSIFFSTILAVCKRGIFLIFYYYIIKHKSVDEISKYFLNIYVLSICGYLIFMGSFFQMLTAYFTFVEILLAGRIFLYTNAKEKLIFCYLIGFFALMQVINALNVYPELYLPYKSSLCQ